MSTKERKLNGIDTWRLMLRALSEGRVQLVSHELSSDSTRTRVRQVILHHHPRIVTTLLCSDFVDAFENAFEDCCIGIIPESTTELWTRALTLNSIGKIRIRCEILEPITDCITCMLRYGSPKQ